MNGFFKSIPSLVPPVSTLSSLEKFDLTKTMISSKRIGYTTSTAQECVDIVVVEEPTAVAISFDSATGACQYSTSVFSYHPRSDGQEPSFYLRTDNVTKTFSALDCLTSPDAEYLIARLSFGDEQCVHQVSEEWGERS